MYASCRCSKRVRLLLLLVVSSMPVAAEAKMLKGMREQLRCCIATIGDGAAADESLYPNLYGTLLIWLGE